MQGQRNSLSMLSENISLDHGSISSDNGIDSHTTWGAMPTSAPNGLPDFTLSSNETTQTSVQYLHRARHDRQNTRWSFGDTSSSAAHNQGNQNERKTEHTWSFHAGVAPTLEEPQYRFPDILSSDNVEIASNGNQATNGSFHLHNSSSVTFPRDLNVSSGFGEHEDEDCQIIERPNMYNSVASSNEHIPSNNSSFDSYGAPSGRGEYNLESSLDGRRVSCKRKALELHTGRPSGEGSSNPFLNAERSQSHTGPAAQIAARKISMPTQTENKLVFSNGSTHTNPRLRFGIEGTSASPFSLPDSGNTGGSHRNLRLRVNSLHQQDFVDPVSAEADAPNQDIIIPYDPLAGLNPVPPVENDSSHRNPRLRVNSLHQQDFVDPAARNQDIIIPYDPLAGLNPVPPVENDSSHRNPRLRVNSLHQQDFVDPAARNQNIIIPYDPLAGLNPVPPVVNDSSHRNPRLRVNSLHQQDFVDPAARNQDIIIPYDPLADLNPVPPVENDSSHRNPSLRVNSLHQQDFVDPAVRNQDIIIPYDPLAGLNPVPPVENDSHHVQYVSSVCQNPQTRWNGASTSRTGQPSASAISREWEASPYEESTSRSIPRNILGHPMFFPAGEIGSSSQNSGNLNSAGGHSGIVRNIPSTFGPPGSGVRSPAPSCPHRSSSQFPRRLSEVVRRSMLSFESAESGEQSSDHALLSGTPIVSQDFHTPNSRLERILDGSFALGYSPRAMAAAYGGRSNIMSEIRHVLNLMRRGEGLRFQDMVGLDHPIFSGMADIHDRHRDLRLDVDNMSYEELLALEERIGDVCTGLSEETIMARLKQYEANAQVETEPCIICQEEYEDGEKLGKLECGHNFHVDCIKQWLVKKNVCPICKKAGLTK